MSAVDLRLAPPVWAEVDLDALRRNARWLAGRVAPARLAVAVKADAYGHGAVPVAEALAAEGVAWFCVARPGEGVALREAGLRGRVLVMGALEADTLEVGALDAYAAYDLEASVTSEAVAEAVAARGAAVRRKTGGRLRVHVKVDTGMHRLGLAPDAVPASVGRLRAAEGVAVEGLWTHFATADEAGSAFAQAQLGRFRAVLAALAEAGVPVPPLVHVANSGASLLFDGGALDGLDLPAGTTGLARVGGLLYGLPSSRDLAARLTAEGAPLAPVMRVAARVVHVQTVAAGEGVSYGQTWTASAPTRIATLAVGYGDGLPRSLSNVGAATVRGRRYTIAGRVCMDLTMLDLGAPDGPGASVRVGDEAVVFGPGGASALDVAEAAGTLPYALTAGLTERVPRRYVGKSEK